jgi:hypothetical protein
MRPNTCLLEQNFDCNLVLAWIACGRRDCSQSGWRLNVEGRWSVVRRVGDVEGFQPDLSFYTVLGDCNRFVHGGVDIQDARSDNLITWRISIGS